MAARVGEGRIEKEREEVVAEVVVGGDVASAAVDVVASQAVGEAKRRLDEPREAAVQMIEGLPVQRDHADRVGEVVGLAEAVHVGFGRPDARRESRCSIEAGIEHSDRG